MEFSESGIQAGPAESVRPDGLAIDVPEPQRTGESQRQGEAVLKEALRAAQIGLWDWVLETDVTTWDENLYGVAGRDPKLPVPQYNEHARLFTPESWRRLKVAVDNALSFGTPYELDLEMVRPDGSKRLVINRGEPRRDASGRITHLRGTLQDITGRKQAAEALGASESRYRLLFENNVAAVICSTLDGRIIDCNKSAARILGYESPQELLSVNMKDIHWDPEKRVGVMARLQAEKSVTGVVSKIRHKTGMPLWVIVNLNLTSSELAGEEIVQGTLIDITERKRAEDELSRSQKELQGVLASIPDFLWSADIDSDGHVTYRYYSPGVEKITGRPPEFYMLGPERWLSTVHPDDMPQIQRSLRAMITGHLPQLTEEYRIILPDGAVRWVRDNVQMRRREGSTRLDGVVSDITAWKETEEALRLSEASLKDALLAAQMGVWEWTVADGTLTWDDSFYRIAGRDPSSLLPEDLEQAKMFTPESWERLKVAGKNALTTGIPFELDLELIRPDGAKRWLTGRGKPWRDALGRITHLRGTVQDITGRKRSEMALQEAETMLRFFVQHAPAPIAMLDREMRYLVVSRRWMTDFHLDDRKIQGLSHYEVFPEIPEHWKEVHRRCLAGSVESCEEDPFPRLDGRIDWVKWEIRPWRKIDNSIGGIIIFSEVINDRKYAKEALRESEAGLAAAQRIAHIGSWEWNLQTNDARWSDETFRIFGVAPGRLEQHRQSFLDLVHAEDEERVDRALAEAVNGTGKYDLDYRIQFPDGARKVIHAQAEIVRDEAGRPLRMQGTVQDITERKRAEEERQRSFDQLRALAAHLQSVREEERMRVAREIHDQLGQALTAIKIDLSSLIRELPDGNTSPSKRTSSILQLVDESIQVVRRISTELRPGILDDLGLVAALEWAGEDFQARTGTTCRLHRSQETIAVGAEHATAIFRIFQETLTNVARHADASVVEVRLAVEQGGLMLEVHDNGKGISKDKLGASKSLGILGMRERAMLLGGELTIEAPPGRGTTVRVRIPGLYPAEGEQVHG